MWRKLGRQTTQVTRPYPRAWLRHAGWKTASQSYAIPPLDATILQGTGALPQLTVMTNTGMILEEYERGVAAVFDVPAVHRWRLMGGMVQ